MSKDKKTEGISIICDKNGKIIEFIYDELKLSKTVTIGQMFTALIDQASLDKAFNFLTTIKIEGSAFDWSLNILLNDGSVTLLHFAGGMTENQMFIVGASTPPNADAMLNELMKINNEQANVLREVMKQQFQLSNQQQRDNRLYEQLTQLNNELTNTQRELTKKNIQLEQQRRELKALNEQLSATIEELERTRDELIQSEKMASLGRLVSGFAHEINTPIGIAVTAVSTLSDAGQQINQMLSQEEVNEDELVSTLERITDASHLTLSNLRRAADLVSSFKRTSIDQSTETKRLFGLREVIQDVILSLNSQFRKTAITIELHCPDSFNIYGYPGAISQIITNLMMNSLIHGFNDGNEAGNITITAIHENNIVTLDYIDTGKGMEPETATKLFEPFYTTRRAKGGLGLGMYLCYNIVTTRLLGKITCDSTKGSGSHFQITFPIEPLTDNLALPI
jgi:signal transduction histidine kinase